MKKLYRSRTNSMIAGVCGGLSEHLEVDPTIVRLGFALLTLYSGIGMIAYIILWVIVPYPDTCTASASETLREGAEEIQEKARQVAESISPAIRGTQGPTTNVVIGIILIGMGLIFLARTLNISWLNWLNPQTLMPIILIIVGILLLSSQKSGKGGK